MLPQHSVALGKKFGEQAMDEAYEKDHTCDMCGAVFTIKHELYDDVLYCPFCGNDTLIDDEETVE